MTAHEILLLPIRAAANGSGLSGLSTEEVLAIATVAVALATIALAWSTRGTVKGIKQDRELAYQPLLSVMFETPKPTASGTYAFETLKVRNSGGGAAIGTRVVYHRDKAWWALSHPLSIQGGTDESIELRVDPSPDGIPWPLLIDHLPGSDSSEDRSRDVALFCEDILGRRLRFLATQTSDGVLFVEPPQIWDTMVWQPVRLWSLKVNPPPPWAIHPLIWAPRTTERMIWQVSEMHYRPFRRKRPYDR